MHADAFQVSASVETFQFRKARPATRLEEGLAEETGALASGALGEHQGILAQSHAARLEPVPEAPDGPANVKPTSFAGPTSTMMTGFYIYD